MTCVFRHPSDRQQPSGVRRCSEGEFVTENGYVIGSIIHDGFLIEQKGSKPILTEVDTYASEKMAFKVEFAWEEFI